MAENIEYPTILILPDELLSIILLNNNCREILNFASTCKRCHTLVSENQYLWKEKSKVTLPKHVYEIVEKYGEGQWLKELKHYYILKHDVIAELFTMSPKYFWRVNEVSMKELERFFNLALAHSTDYYYVVSVLQEVIQTENDFVRKEYPNKPYTLTEMYYAKIALRYLTQIYLALKWFQSHLKSELSPERVLNFFVQWTDTAKIHSDEDIDNSIQMVIADVEDSFGRVFPNDETRYTIPERIAKGLKHKDVLINVSEVIFNQHHLAIMPSANIDTLDIAKVLKTKCGHAIAVAAIYQSVAHRCGTQCELIAFPNHLYLEWRDQDQTIHKINLDSGTVTPKRRCPYSHGPIKDNVRYCPDTFLQYIVATYLITTGALTNWSTRNAMFLQDFLSTNPTDENPYKEYQEYLLDYDRLSAMYIPLKREFLDESHLKILKHLVKITYSPPPITRPEIVNPHDSRVIFAVGIICYNQEHNYFCVVRGWDPTCYIEMCGRREFQSLSCGTDQPFYTVIAIDQTERYVAQEHLVAVSHPNRLHHLEDIIATEFTHFDGFCYIPNAEKDREYPQDGPIRDALRGRYDLRVKQEMEQPTVSVE